MMIQEVPYDSPFYELTKALRDEVLRKPLGLQLNVKDIEGEAEQIHIAAIENNQVMGCVILKPLSDDTVKLRQMAVSAMRQGKGLGKTLVLFAEEIARNKNFNMIELHARVSAQIFYEKLGYAAIGDIFTEVTIPTIKMYKKESL